ncbi:MULTISPECIES: cell envelope integrity TolA C-terminal domain-containing protein [Enterobacteriaceae]|uniref:cell envelope integrity TolA C-terminal domain-containing protein n=1 Tax=Enterobacteriaceae TaxID=543 RepID=UPI00226B620E|nr:MULTISPECIES: cell envelope integrity TolA C-terminal domain-containing protein [Enterobacteriaceae]MCX9044703.1 hypothetical protein [Citrobacter portucalensis]MDA8491015.1 hypothetical protein [Kluyvera sp. Awk 3]
MKLKIIVLISLAATAMSGCTIKNPIGDCNPQAMECAKVESTDRTAPLYTKPSPVALSREYGAVVGRQIYRLLPNPHQFAGQSCVLRIKLTSEGLLKDVHTEYPAGSKDYCAALKAVTQKTTYPQPPAGALTDAGDLMPLNFKELPPVVMQAP